MIKNKAFLTGLDIGSSRIAAVVAEAGAEGSLSVIAHATKETSGVSRGVITGLDEVARSITAVLLKLKSKTGGSLGEVCVNMSAETVKGAVSKGMIPLALRGREITRGDMDRAAQAAGTIHLPIDREILHRIVLSYSVDDQPWIQNALGLFASRLSCKTYMITGDTNHIQNVHKCLHLAGCDVHRMVFTGIADAQSVLSPAEKMDGALLLDIGSSLTNACIFSEGVLQCLEVIGIGGKDMMGDFKNDPALNRALGIVHSKVLPCIQGTSIPRTIVVTGGMAFADGLIEAIEEKLSHPVKIGTIKDVRGELSGQDSVRLSTAVGLAKYANELRQQNSRDAKATAKRLSEKVVDLFNNYF